MLFRSEESGVLELPLHIQDTALFYPDRMNLDEKEAMETVEDLVRTVERTGGVLTVNWHHRSLAPERLWEDFYLALLDRLRKNSPWFTKAIDAVRWFEKRRSVVFGPARTAPESLNLELTVEGDGTVPDLLLQVHLPETREERNSFRLPAGGGRCIDIPISGNGSIALSLKSTDFAKEQSGNL